MAKKIVLVVCWGNIYRSPVAKIFLDREIKKRGLEKELVCESRGIHGSGNVPPTKFPNFSCYEEECRAAKPVMEKYGLDLTNQISQPIDEQIIAESAIIFALDEKTQKAIISRFPQAEKKIHLLTELTGKPRSIEDPDGVTETEKYEAVTKEIHDCVTSGFPKLLNLLKLV